MSKVSGIFLVVILFSSIISVVPPAFAGNDKSTEKLAVVLKSETGENTKPISKIKKEVPYPNISQKVSQNILSTLEIPAGVLNLNDPKFQTKIPVYIYLDKSESFSTLPSNIDIKAQAGKIVAAKLSLNEMNDLSLLESVVNIGIPHMAEFDSHAVSEGVSFTMADNFHNLGIDGTGVTIAIIDGGFFPNDPEIAGNVISSALFDAFNFCNGDIACGASAGNSHGTAVAEVVVDEAPGVNLRLYTIATNIDYNNAVDDAIANGVDVITASLGFPTLGSDGVGPNAKYFRAGTSDVAKKMNEAYNNGIFGTISAGNDGDSHWMGTYVPSSTVSLSGYESVMEFQPNANGVQKACLPFTNNGWRVIAAWDDAINKNNDYDLFIFKSNLKTLISLSTLSQPPQNPIEIAPGGFSPGGACIVVASFSSTEDHLFHIYLDNNVIDPSFMVRSGSIGTPADSSGVMGIGAIRAANPAATPPTPIDNIEPFSSSGPTDDGRPKPEICGPDGNLSHQSGLDPFLGTSSSAPHTAGAAALFLQQDPSLTPSQLKNVMTESARFNSNYSVDNLCGANSGALKIIDISDPRIFCNDMTISQLIASGTYNLIDNRGGASALLVGTVNDDLILAGDMGDQLKGGIGDDCLIGGAGVDIIHGLENNDMMFGEGGNDQMYGGIGDDQISGGLGNDLLRGSAGADIVMGDEGNDNLGGGPGIDELRGGLGDDAINGNGENDSLFGEEGNDLLVGAGGDDFLDGGDDVDDLRGGNGIDELRGGLGDDILNGNGENDSLFGEEGNDLLVGGTGDDFLDGGDGADDLRGGPGLNELRGGSGDDLLVGHTNNDSLFGEEGNDLLLGGAGDDFLDGGDDVDELRGGPGLNELRGGSGDDLLVGHINNETLFGEEGNDLLLGGAGDDFLDGGQGADDLRGGQGFDTCVSDISDTLVICEA